MYKLLLISFIFASSSPAFAQDISDITVDPKNPAQNQSIHLVIKSAGERLACGLEVNFGDGTVRRIRGDAFPLTVEHVYQKDGKYTISVTGQVIIRGLRSLLACAGNKSLALQVGGSEVAEAAPDSSATLALPQLDQLLNSVQQQVNQGGATDSQQPTPTDDSNLTKQSTIDFTKFKNKSGIYHSLFLANQTPRICAISSEVVNNTGGRKNLRAEIMHNVAVISFSTNIQKYAPKAYKLPKLIKPSTNHPFIEQRRSVKWWLPEKGTRPDYRDHFERNHEPWANNLLEDGFHQYIGKDFIDKIGKGVISAGNHSTLPGDNRVDVRGCSVLVGFQEEIKQAAVGLSHYGHKFQVGKTVSLDQLLEDYAGDYWNVKWNTYEYVRFNIAISPSTMLLLRELGFDSPSELAKLAQAVKSGHFENEYFSKLNSREEKHAIDVYLQDLHRSKKIGSALLAVRDSRQKFDDEFVVRDSKDSEKRRAEIAATERAERATERAERSAQEKRRERLRSNMTISTGVSCIADEQYGAKEINYIAGMYASNTNIAIITSYVTNIRVCHFTRQTYAAKNFKELNLRGQLVTLQSKTKTAEGEFIFTMVNVKEWNVD